MRKFRARKNRGGAGKREKFPPFFFRVRAFSIPLARLSRSLEQAKDERPANSGDVLSLTRQHTKIQPKNTGRAKTVTTLRLEKCAFRHALGAHKFYTSPLIKCQIT